MVTGNIILLNGASSSGKTSILQVLQEIMDEPYLNAGIDKFLWMLPKRYLDRPLWDEIMGLEDRPGPLGIVLMRGMHEAIARLAVCGNNIVADHVMVDQSWVIDCANLFADLPAYFIGIRCPVDILEERERQRKNRTLGQARLQDAVVHSYASYDLEIDTSINNPAQCASQIKEYVLSGSKPSAFRKLREGSR